MNDKLTTQASVNYVRNTGRNRPGVGYSGNGASILESFVHQPPVDINALKNGWKNSAEGDG